MAARASLFRYRHDAVLRAGDGATHEQEVALRIDLHHAKPELGVALSAHVTRHPLAFDNARGVGTRADRAGLAVPGVAVGRGATAEMVAVHHTLESPALGGAGHLHQLPRREDVDLDLGARRRCVALEGEDPQDLRRYLQAGLLGVPQLRLAGALGAASPESELNTSVADLHHT